MPTDVAALLGNGISVDYSAGLTVAALTEHISHRFHDGDLEDDVSHALSALARSVIPDRDPNDDFEDLLQPLETVALALAPLSRLTGLPKQLLTADVQTHLTESMDYLRRLHQRGVGLLLAQIAGQSAGDQNRIEHLDSYLDEIVDTAAGGQVTVATLSYDLLLDFAANRLKDRGRVNLADLAVGYGPTRISVGDNEHLNGYALRTNSTVWPSGGGGASDLHLLHLHGALTWLSPLNGQTVKIDAASLRQKEYWQGWADGRFNAQPMVILTNQERKSRAVAEEPFALAYDIFRERLRTSPKWVIAGYGFRDIPVNDLLSESLGWRTAESLETEVVVHLCGDSPDDATVSESLSHEPNLSISRKGFWNAIGEPAWTQFRGQLATNEARKRRELLDIR